MRKSNEYDSGLIDYQTKKSVHINLTKSTHGELRVILLRMGLSMQEVFDTIASMICEKDSYLMQTLSRIEKQKRERQIKKVSKSDAASIFDIIESDNPFDSEEV
tara:strand:+ start:29 stop:340 length:312 start_codon:yes stop_codon:yes gene_type:complete